MRTIVLFLDEKGQRYCIWDDIKKEGNKIFKGVDFFRSKVKEWQDSKVVSVGRFSTPKETIDAYRVCLQKQDPETKQQDYKDILVYLNREAETTVTREQFCSIVDSLNIGPTDKQFLRGFANEPSTTDVMVDQALEELIVSNLCPALS